MIQITTKQITVNEQGEWVEFDISLPGNAQRIVGIMVTNNDVGNLNFPSAPPFTLPGVVPFFRDSTYAVVETWLQAIETGAEYEKWDTLVRKTTYRYLGGVLEDSENSYHNFSTNTDIAEPPRAHVQPIEQDTSLYEEIVESLSFLLTNTIKSYPFGLVTPAPLVPNYYRSVIVSIEADATTDSEVKYLARFGTSALSATTGFGFVEGATMTLTKRQFEQGYFTGLQVGKTHTVQLQFIN